MGIAEVYQHKYLGNIYYVFHLIHNFYFLEIITIVRCLGSAYTLTSVQTFNFMQT
jgi:hypothetical protein